MLANWSILTFHGSGQLLQQGHEPLAPQKLWAVCTGTVIGSVQDLARHRWRAQQWVHHRVRQLQVCLGGEAVWQKLR